jgi:hypothetical protein
MAIHKELWRKSAKNTAAIAVSTPFNTAFRVRMTDEERGLYGACNHFLFVNDSAVKVEIKWNWNNEATDTDRTILPAKTAIEIPVSMGRRSYGFDVYNMDAATEVAIGEFSYEMAKILEVPEGG